MSEAHDQMVKALKEIVVPKLREQGFKGSFPHFRRSGKDKIDLLTFQFDKWGGGFVVEISQCPVGGITTYYGKFIPPNKVTSWDTDLTTRYRLQPRAGSSTDDWFRFDGSSQYESSHPELVGQLFPFVQPGPEETVFEKTARQVLPFLQMAEDWWKE